MTLPCVTADDSTAPPSPATGPVPRVLATDAARALLAEIITRHGPVLFHQSGGCCDGSSPMCYPRSDFRVGDRDIQLGSIDETPVYISPSQFAAWQHTQLILDMVPGRGGMFSLDNGTERRFLTRSRAFHDAELARLAPVTMGPEKPG